MSKARSATELLEEAHDALRQMLVSGIRSSAPLVRRCGELADELKAADVRPAAEQLRAVAETEDDGRRLGAVFRALVLVRQARLHLAGPAKVDAASH